MAKIKNIFLNGSEVKVNIIGQNCDIRNDGVDTVYISTNPDIVAGETDVLSVPAGQSAKLLDSCGTVYLLGTGTVVLCGNDHAYLVFRTAATSAGDGGIDQLARDAINAHAADLNIHLTEEDAVNAAAVTISNPNLLINPDFRINQRGESVYSEVGYTADRWKLQFPNSAASIEDGGYKLGLTSSAIDNSIASVIQTIEEPERFCGRMVTLSVDYKTVVSNRVYIEVATTDHSDASHVVAGKFITEGTGKYSVTGIIPNDVKTMFVRIYGADRRAGDDIDAYSIINYAKLELGSIATPFTPPDPATELAKCQRYYQIHSTGDIAEVDLRPTMRDIPVVSEASGGYAYEVDI